MTFRIAARSAALAVAITGVGAITLTGCAPTNREATPAKAFKQVTFPSNIAPTVVEIDNNVQQRALSEISLAFNSSNPVIKAQSLEAMSRTKDPAAADRVARALVDKNWIVRFAGAMCAGDLKLKSAYRAILAVAYDSDPNVRVATRYALHQMGDKSLSKDLEALSIHDNSAVRGNVAIVLGQMNEPTAVRLLEPMINDSVYEVKLQAAEAMWKLGREMGMKYLIAGTVSGYVDDQIFAIQGLASTHDQRVKPYLMAKLANDHDGKQFVELQLAAARGLGMLGDDAGYGLAVRTCASSDPRQRALAALALGEIGRSDAQDALAKLLDDPTPEVRLSAATALRLIGNRNRP